MFKTNQMSHKVFFKEIRRVFPGRLTQQKVDAINKIMEAFDEVGDGNVKTIAYAFATAYGESQFRTVREGFKKTDASARKYVQANYGRKGKDWYCWPAGPYNHVYYGRGYPQLTWYTNYRDSSKDAGVDLVKYPDKLLDPKISAKLLILGIQDGRWNGKGKGIQSYLPENGKDDIKNARRTVNVTDRWQKFGGYYRKFYSAFQTAIQAGPDRAPVAKKPAPEPTLPEPAPVAPKPAPEVPKTPEVSETPAPKTKMTGVVSVIVMLILGVLFYLGVIDADDMNNILQ